MLNQNLLLTGDDAYNLSKSLRFRSSASAYLNRTPASAGNRKTWTWSAWVKRGALGANAPIFQSGNPTSPWFLAQFETDNTFQVSFSAGVSGGTYTTQVFRDSSAWYHIVIAVDTTQATASNRLKLYVNGSQITAFSSTNYPALNFDTQVNNTISHTIGAFSTNAFDGYLAEVNFIDGQALTPSSFGETSATTGVWIPKKYTGTYGTNGFYLPFTDVATTSGSNAGLGKDFSGNGNYWTTNNISVTSGSTYDSMKDVPTLTDTDTANYSTWNPVNNGLGGTVSFANMRLSGVSNVDSRINSTIGVNSGKWYFEATLTTADAYTTIGIGQGNITNQYPGKDALSYAQTLEQATSINNNSQPSYGTAFSSGDVFICAFDLDNNKLFFGRNGTWFGSSVPSTGTNPVYTLTAGTYNVIARPNPSGFASSAVLDINFGQRPFAYTPPTGFKALNTFNLPTPTIGATASTQANKYFDATLYTGTGSSQSIVNSGSMQPDFVWTKSRSSASTHLLFDSIRGVYNYLISATTDAEGSLNTTLTAFNSNGFSVGSNSTINNNSSTNVAWQWRASNTTAVTNTAGSITSTVSANTTAGFSIVTYTGNNTLSTVGHGLGASPAMIIVKDRSASNPWIVYHQSLGVQYYTLLSSTDASYNNLSNYWSSTAPSSTVFGINAYGGVNTNGDNYVAYCFAEVAGYSKAFSYTGNGSSDGAFVFLGFRARYVMIKCSSSTGGWVLLDTARDPYNDVDNYLYANSSAADAGSSNVLDINSNGFKIRNSWTDINGSGSSYVGFAFSEHPFKYSLAR